ncbi:MAG: energy transducer TonB [Terracidiphilus sp.]
MSVAAQETRPASDATATSTTSVKLPLGVVPGVLVNRVAPKYPLRAKLAFVQGTVVLQGTIGKDGHMANLHAVSGPGSLRNAALKAVEQWIYKPYELNGQPAEVQTTVNVVFTLSR